MQEQRVTKEQAIRLKQAGYPTKHPFHVDINGNSFPEPEQIEITISDATRWLREVKGWHVATGFNEGYWCIDGYEIKPKKIPGKFGTNYYYDTHDTALSAGIDAVLDQIEKEVQNG